MGLALVVVRLLEHGALVLLENPSSPNGSKQCCFNTRELGKRVQHSHVPGMWELPSSGARGSRPCWTQGFIYTLCLPSWVREDVWGLNGGEPQKLECPGGFRNNQARTGICPFVGRMVAAERSWSLEMGLGGSCWCHDGASCTRRAGGELNVG